ncbi:tetratricopeptide repeat protein [Temperatibacter marinus]|uniref:Tetratricopeptide repeat protein n=1 Tax=Temperatibacter marinus TaxID=1456591 RepID=A0AA52EAP7_9PROT|nr:tetratricopeptide repeat protein [Temperatibacter marinus]WND01832.1 tetratricopeptide repeat protein [Temperatibacter marinus]
MFTLTAVKTTITTLALSGSLFLTNAALAHDNSLHVTVQPNADLKSGTIALQKGDYKKAYSKLKRASRINLAPAHKANAYNNLCVAEQNLGKFEDAISSCKAALKHDRQNWRANLNLGVIYIILEQPEKAMTYLSKAKKQQANVATINRLIAKASTAIEMKSFAAK